MTFNLKTYIKKDEAEEVVYKPLQYVNMPQILQESISLPGIPLGYLSMAYGLSDSGKTELLLKIAQEAIKQEVLPIIVVGENKLDKSRLTDKGLIHGENCIIEESITTLEDFYDFVSMKVEDVKAGRLKMNCMVLLDSIASLPSKESFEIDKSGKIIKKYGPQKNAAVIGYYNPIIANRVASTRQMNCDYSLGVFMVNQAYIKPPEFPGAPTIIVPNGGEKIWFTLGLSLEVKEGQRIKVKVNGTEHKIGLVCKLTVQKNHINGQYTSGEVLLFGNEMLPNDDKHVEQIKEMFKSQVK